MFCRWACTADIFCSQCVWKVGCSGPECSFEVLLYFAGVSFFGLDVGLGSFRRQTCFSPVLDDRHLKPGDLDVRCVLLAVHCMCSVVTRRALAASVAPMSISMF